MVAIDDFFENAKKGILFGVETKQRIRNKN